MTRSVGRQLKEKWMSLHRFKVSNATYGDVPLTDAEVALVVDDPIVGNIGFWTADGTSAAPPQFRAPETILSEVFLAAR
jgi:hypothetical protein